MLTTNGSFGKFHDLKTLLEPTFTFIVAFVPFTYFPAPSKLPLPPFKDNVISTTSSLVSSTQTALIVLSLPMALSVYSLS